MTTIVENAVKFLKQIDGKYPCVSGIEFLQKKGLTNDEITEAVFTAAAQLEQQNLDAIWAQNTYVV